jgi:hypothetical protein
MPSYLWIQEVIFPLIGMGIGSFVLYGAYRTVNRMLDRRHEARQAGGAGVVEEIRGLEERVVMLEEQAGRVQELEERLDFAERMLAKQGQRPLLGDH